MSKNYDTIAGIYDRLARMVYGNTIVAAQQYLAGAVPPDTHVLIVGGGTGWILEEITRIHASGVSITYVDPSAKMIALSRARNTGSNRVTFINSSIETARTGEVYDVVMTPFLFDNFSERTMRDIFEIIDNHLTPGGIWLYSDFQNTRALWQKAMLKLMYLFFRVSCGIEASSLPDTEACFADHKYTIQSQKAFLNGFIASTVYVKAD